MAGSEGGRRFRTMAGCRRPSRGTARCKGFRHIANGVRVDCRPAGAIDGEERVSQPPAPVSRGCRRLGPSRPGSGTATSARTDGKGRGRASAVCPANRLCGVRAGQPSGGEAETSTAALCGTRPRCRCRQRILRPLGPVVGSPPHPDPRSVRRQRASQPCRLPAVITFRNSTGTLRFQPV
jgi:hypothetical protein